MTKIAAARRDRKPRPNPPPASGRGCPHRRVTRLTVQQQHAMARAIKNAREMALLPYGSSTVTSAKAGR